MLPLSHCYIEISVVSQCRILMTVNMNTAVCIFFSTNNLHLLDFSVTWSLLMLTDADWTCYTNLKLTQTAATPYTGCTLPTNSPNTNLKLIQTAATPYTGCTLPTNSTLWAAAADASTMAEKMPPQLLSSASMMAPSHDDTMNKQCYL